MDIQVIKLVSGEEIITEIQRVQTQDGSYLTMVNPCGIVLSEEAGGRIKQTFLPIAFAAKDRTVVLSPDAIVYTAEPTEEAAATYQKRFSKIITPEQKLVIAQ